MYLNKEVYFIFRKYVFTLKGKHNKIHIYPYLGMARQESIQL